jgi:hypothetical protein
VQTSVNNVVVDAHFEITVLSTRTVAAIKERLRRVIPGKPPLSTIALWFQGQPLDDEQTVQDILQELAEDAELDDDDDDKDENDDENDESKDDTRRIVLTLDMLPPVDPKFVAQLDEKMPDLTTSQLLDAYAMNEAVLYHNHAALLAAAAAAAQQEQSASSENDTGKGGEQNEDSTQQQQQQQQRQPIHLQLQQEAARIRQDLELLLMQKQQPSGSSSSISPQQQQQQQQDGGGGGSIISKVTELLNDVETPVVKAKLQAANPIQKRGHRVRHYAAIGTGITTTTSSTSTSRSSSYTTLRRMIQTNFNVQWGDTLRYFCLFIFFGYFGGRTPASRAILLLGAPSVFVLQARPVKLLLKQVLYTLLDHPYGILLSLLPAPQQAILSLNHAEAMKTIYGIPAPAAGKATKRTGRKRTSTRKAGPTSNDSDDDGQDQDELERQEQFLDKMRDEDDDDDESDEEFFDAREEEEEESEDDEDDE